MAVVQGSDYGLYQALTHILQKYTTESSPQPDKITSNPNKLVF